VPAAQGAIVVVLRVAEEGTVVEIAEIAGLALTAEIAGIKEGIAAGSVVHDQLLQHVAALMQSRKN
jgi:hypothetical protein